MLTVHNITAGMMISMKTLVVPLVLWASFLIAPYKAATMEEMLFESFLANYSRSYRNDPDWTSARFDIFQVRSMYIAYILMA